MEYIIADEDRYLLDTILPYFELDATLNITNSLLKGLKQRGENPLSFRIPEKSRVLSEFLIKYDFARGSRLDPIITYKGKVLRDCGSLAVFEEKNPPRPPRKPFPFSFGKKKKENPPAEARAARTPAPAKERKPLFAFLKRKAKPAAPPPATQEPIPAAAAAERLAPESVTSARPEPIRWQNSEERYKFQKLKGDGTIIAFQPANGAAGDYRPQPVLVDAPAARTAQPAIVTDYRTAAPPAETRMPAPEAPAPKKAAKTATKEAPAESVSARKINYLYLLYCLALGIACLSFYLLFLEHKKRLQESALMERRIEVKVQAVKNDMQRHVDSLEARMNALSGQLRSLDSAKAQAHH